MTQGILYFKQKTSLLWQEIRSTRQQWKHQTRATDHAGYATVLGQGGNSWCWDKSHPGRQKDQIPLNLVLVDTPARLPRSACSGRRQRLPVLTAQEAGTSLGTSQGQILLFCCFGQPASLKERSCSAHTRSCPTCVHVRPRACLRSVSKLRGCVFLSTALVSPLAFFFKNTMEWSAQ